MTKAIYEDPVVAEIHEIRRLLLDQCNSDIHEYRKQVCERQQLSVRRVITQPLRKHNAAHLAAANHT